MAINEEKKQAQTKIGNMRHGFQEMEKRPALLAPASPIVPDLIGPFLHSNYPDLPTDMGA